MLDQFARQNRWWVDPTEVDRDRHLWRLHEAPLRWVPPLPFDFDRDAIYTLRGPRQVGKSTILKRQIAALLADHWSPDHILYLDVELAGLETAQDLVESLRAYIDSRKPFRNAGQPDVSGRLVILLDEVTRVETGLERFAVSSTMVQLPECDAHRDRQPHHRPAAGWRATAWSPWRRPSSFDVEPSAAELSRLRHPRRSNAPPARDCRRDDASRPSREQAFSSLDST